MVAEASQTNQPYLAVRVGRVLTYVNDRAALESHSEAWERARELATSVFGPEPDAFTAAAAAEQRRIERRGRGQLLGRDCWLDVQAILAAHAQTPAKTRSTDHYLEGSLTRDTCGGRLAISWSTGRRGVKGAKVCPPSNRLPREGFIARHEAGTTNPGPLNEDRGSRTDLLVEVRGLEPLTPCLPGKCSTS